MTKTTFEVSRERTSPGKGVWQIWSICGKDRRCIRGGYSSRSAAMRELEEIEADVADQERERIAAELRVMKAKIRNVKKTARKKVSR